MKNRKLAWILGVVLVAGMIAGCGSEKKTEENTTVTESQEEESEDSEEADETENTEETDDAEEEDTEVTDSEETETLEDTEDAAEDETAASEGVKGDFDSATASVAGWNYQMPQIIKETSYLNVPEKPALESVVDLIEQAYRKQHRSELGLKVMLEECFSMTNWYQTLYSRYENFKEKHARDLTCINRDLLLTLETMLSLCINSYYQSTFILHLKEAVDELNRIVAQAAEQ